MRKRPGQIKPGLHSNSLKESATSVAKLGTRPPIVDQMVAAGVNDVKVVIKDKVETDKFKK